MKKSEIFLIGLVCVVGLAGAAKAASLVTIASTPSSDGSASITFSGSAVQLFGGAVPLTGYKVALTSATQSSTPCWVSDSTSTPSATTTGSYPVFFQGQYSTEVGEKPIGPVYIWCPAGTVIVSAKKW